MPMIPDNETARRRRATTLATPPMLTLCIVRRTPDGQIITESRVTAGRIIQAVIKLPVPPEWLARAIPLDLDDSSGLRSDELRRDKEEDAPCR